jgi:RsiW-degrading membrane proteinase PrsW (M82 family)
LILYVTLAICALLAAVLVYRYDLYDREPLPLVGLAIGLGALAMALAGQVELFVFERQRLEGELTQAAVAGLVEETGKLAAVLAVAFLARQAADDPMDGLIYGSLAGLGAALEEGVAVLRGLPSGTSWLPPEELVRLCGHLVMGGLAGFGVSRARGRDPGWPGALVFGFVCAIVLHFGWDTLSLQAAHFPQGPSRPALLAGALMLGGLLLYGRLVVVATGWSQQVFARGVAGRLRPSRPL